MNETPQTFEAHECQEAISSIGTEPILCREPAGTLVGYAGRPDEGPYWMCVPHADHTIHNRRGVDVTPYESEHTRARKATAATKIAGKPKKPPKPKGGKWSSLKGTLDAKPVDPGFDELVRAAFDALADVSTRDVMARAEAARVEKKEHEAAVERLNVTIEALNRKLLLHLEANDTTSIKSESLGRLFFLQVEPHPTVEDQDAVDLWADEHGMGHQRHLAWGTLKAEVKRRMEEGEALPPGIKVYVQTSVRNRKG